jgi:membrane protein DedA with SNARE-associated domain
MSGLVHHFGLLALFLIVMLESGGVPLPGETAVIAAGVFASRGELNIAAVIAVAATAAIVGDNLGYWVGRTGGRSLFMRWTITSGTLPWAESFFERHGPKTIFIGRFFSILRVTAAWMAGVSRMRWGTFFFWNAAGGICWALLVGLIAYYAGQAAGDAISHYGLIGGAAIVALGLGGLVGFHFWRKRLVESP